jgi:MFS family permease
VPGFVDVRFPSRSLPRRLLTESRRPAAVRQSPRAHWYVAGTVCIGAIMWPARREHRHARAAAIGARAACQRRRGRVGHAGVLLVLIATVAALGRLADAVGRKLLYVYGFGVFTAGSVLCGLAPNLAMLILSRVLQAVGAAMLQANSVALITEAMPPKLLGRGIGVQGTAQALGLALGPAVGGALLALGGWRLIFLVNLPAGALGLSLGWFLLPRSRSRRAIGDGDRLGAVLLALAVAGPLLHLSLAPHAGYANALLLLALAGGALCGVSFVARERRADARLIDLSTLRPPAISIGLSSGLVSYLVLFGTLFVVPYYLGAEHTGAALIGLQLAVLPVAIGIAAPIAGRLANRIGELPLTAGGLLMTGVGLREIALRHGTAGLLTGLAMAGLGASRPRDPRPPEPRPREPRQHRRGPGGTRHDDRVPHPRPARPRHRTRPAPRSASSPCASPFGTLCPRLRASIEEWRDPDLNRGHHDFQLCASGTRI